MIKPRVAIVDYGVGNLFSVAQACVHVGLSAEISSDAARIVSADAVILPGVGSFGFAMSRLRDLGLVNTLLETANADKPLMGVCLGFQLLFDESEEMGRTSGLGLISGTVRPLANAIRATEPKLKIRIPNIAWLPITLPQRLAHQTHWTSGLMNGLAGGSSLYFVHSYFAELEQENDVVAETTYQDFTYCCATERENVFGCQFHPEKSSSAGLQIYQNLARRLLK
jgi:imidazole glycerol-phosphate synthase subunit HisH